MLDKKNKAILLLEDGHFFYGNASGKIGTTTGEICFNTSMTGYQEIFTDPSYFGQILIMNNVHIGNYGINNVEQESASIQIKGLICNSIEKNFSRFKSTQNIQNFLETNHIIAIDGIDTRALVRYIRDKGVMNCLISSEELPLDVLQKKLADTPSMDGLALDSFVSTPSPFEIKNENYTHTIAVLDFGIKNSILDNLHQRKFNLKVFPSNTDYNEIKSYNPDGYFLSNGPGDPAAMQDIIKTIQKILTDNKPVFGICLGHQLLGLANNVKTYKLHNGHRGGNHPVKNLQTGICEITTQNHGFGIDRISVEQNNNIEITHINLNDGSIEGIALKNKPAFSVQYHPESTPGPNDSKYLFDKFADLILQK
ncbi:MAG: glutamine-hydrolyzing carbamoyl-phosphate synthase small subunit [Sediminibacterium sp.]|nr:glutamine-hydrolyzing carbamoyl-phosphate synthase small subunit [Sediminibacterium sp.]